MPRFTVALASNEHRKIRPLVYGTMAPASEWSAEWLAFARRRERNGQRGYIMNRSASSTMPSNMPITNPIIIPIVNVFESKNPLFYSRKKRDIKKEFRGLRLAGTSHSHGGAWELQEPFGGQLALRTNEVHAEMVVYCQG